jgi:chromosome segregation ATPase
MKEEILKMTEKQQITFEKSLEKFLHEASNVIEPQDALQTKLNELTGQLQEKESKVQELTVKDPAADIESLYDEIQSLEKQINIVNLKLKAFPAPEEIDRDLKSVLQRAAEREPNNGLIKFAQEVRDTGIQEMNDIQQKIDELKKFIPEIQQKLATNCEAIGNLERQKHAMAGQLLDLDACLQKDQRKHPKPKPALSWSACIPDEDFIGKYFGTEIPPFKWEFGKSLGITTG